LRRAVLVTKKPQAYRTIGEASAAVGVPAHVLRFWETKFSQIRPMKKGGGRRYYRPEDIGLLCGIRVFLYEQDFSIKALQALLRKEGVDKVIRAGAPVPAKEKPEQTPEPVEVATKITEVSKPVAKEEPVASKPDSDTGTATEKDDALRNALSRLQGARKNLSSVLKNS
jgi:DNA-binding transcriptional MerR regulator